MCALKASEAAASTSPPPAAAAATKLPAADLFSSTTHFPRQAEAFLYADGLAAAAAAAAAAPSSSSSSSAASQLAVFSFEAPPRGVRRFGAAPASALFEALAATPPFKRHLYEILREGMPVHLYLDLEYDLAANPGAGGGGGGSEGGDRLVESVMASVRKALQRHVPALAAFLAGGDSEGTGRDPIASFVELASVSRPDASASASG